MPALLVATAEGAGALSVLFNDVVCAFTANPINVKPISKPVLKSFVNVFFITNKGLNKFCPKGAAASLAEC